MSCVSSLAVGGGSGGGGGGPGGGKRSASKDGGWSKSSKRRGRPWCSDDSEDGEGEGNRSGDGNPGKLYLKVVFS